MTQEPAEHPEHHLVVDGFRPWCLRCRRPGRVCLCEHIGRLHPRTKFVFLMHPMEARKTKNGTGRVTHLTLADSELIVGIDFRQDPRVQALLADPGLACRLLYPDAPGHPSEQASALREPAPNDPRRPTLIVLDGTWPCAKKMMRVSTNLHALPRVSLTIDRPSEFVTKHQPHPLCLATIEAVDRTLRALAEAGLEQYDDDDSEALLRPFRRMIAMDLEHAATSGPKSFRGNGPFKKPEERARRRQGEGSARSVVFRG